MRKTELIILIVVSAGMLGFGLMRLRGLAEEPATKGKTGVRHLRPKLMVFSAGFFILTGLFFLVSEMTK
jgi:hypothetical protein